MVADASDSCLRRGFYRTVAEALDERLLVRFFVSLAFQHSLRVTGRWGVWCLAVLEESPGQGASGWLWEP